MRIKCKQTTSQGFDLTEVTTVFTHDHDYSLNGFGIELGKDYLVMGVAVYKDTNCLYYLIDINGRPDWYPYLLFDIVDSTIPSQWFMKIHHKNEDTDLYTLLGFRELCCVENFYDHLQDRVNAALQIYFNRKIELEKSMQS